MIAILNYGIGNIGSIANMLKKSGLAAEITADTKKITQAKGLILPGVGSFDKGMQHLLAAPFFDTLQTQVLTHRVPILGICLGMALLGKGSEEGTSQGLGWLPAKMTRFRFDDDKPTLKVPHMGWKNLSFPKQSILFPNAQERRFYFVHSYHMVCEDENHVAARAHYGHDFVASVAHENIFGVQFHPEKSHRFGFALFAEFAKCCLE